MKYYAGLERRRAVEECPRLMVQRALRQLRGEGGPEEFVILAAGKLRPLWLAVWQQDEVHWYADVEWDGRRVARRQVLRLSPSYPAIGGTRWWWECPGWRSWPEFARDEVNGCRRQVARLYLRNGQWACRTCHDLTYLSCRNSRRKRTLAVDE